MSHPRLQIVSTPGRSIIYSFGLLFCLNAVNLAAQSAPPQQPQCFNIHVRLNGKPLDGPRVRTLKTNQNESTASLEGGCFRVPPSLFTEKNLDVSFTVSRNKIYLSQIATGFFAGPWDIDLQDRKFGTNAHLPKHAVAKKACAVVFHVGEPETAMAQTKCRTTIADAAR